MLAVMCSAVLFPLFNHQEPCIGTKECLAAAVAYVFPLLQFLLSDVRVSGGDHELTNNHSTDCIGNSLKFVYKVMETSALLESGKYERDLRLNAIFHMVPEGLYGE